MKLSCLQENLSKGLGIVGRAVATRTTLPITNNVLLATDEGRLRLAATNLEIAISCWLGAKVEEEGAITIPARLLTDFVNSLPNERVDMTLSPRTRTLELKCARSEGRINGVEAEEFPPIPSIGEGITTKIDAEALRLAITQVAFAAATEETRPVLTGVHSEFDGDRLTLAAADGFRLAVHKAPLAVPVAERTEVIIPARAFSELHRLLTDEEEPIEVTINPQRSQVLFRLKDVEMVSQLIQGAFPNYTQLIPQSYVTRAEMSLSELAKATRTASIFAREGSAIVRLLIVPGEELAPGMVVLSARAEEVGDNVGEVDATVEGEEARIAFNSKYLSDVLGVLRQDRVVLETTSPSSPGVIRPVGVDNYVHVVMPMFVQW
ncbi:MAG: DNA polymerase III subunit beta [Dehalococcoidia bacterium]